MINVAIKYPYLERLSPGIHEPAVQNIFNSISHIPLCWLATEELELYFETNPVKDYLYFHKSRYSIEVRLCITHRPIAKVHFES